jgi:hypothetical protein
LKDFGFFKRIFWRLWFWMVKYLSSHNSSFALIYIFKFKWQGHPLFENWLCKHGFWRVEGAGGGEEEILHGMWFSGAAVPSRICLPSLLSGQNEVEALHQNPFSALLQRWFATLACRRGEGQTESEKTGRERGPVKRNKKHRIVFKASKANQWVSRLSFWAHFEVYTGVVFFMLWTLSPLADAMVSHGRTREHGMSTEKSNKNNL